MIGDKGKEARVHHVFERVAENYDQMNTVISFQQHKRWRKDTMKRMQVQAGNDILDVCCGTGDWTLALAEATGSTGNVIGIDFSENMLAAAKKKAAEQKTKIEWMQGNAMALPFADNTFDIVTIGFGLRNVPDLVTVLKEMQRVVKPGGKVVCLETSQPTLIGWRQLYYAYFRFIMPLLGKLFAKSYQEYSWLQESARDFPGKEELSHYFQSAGLTNIVVKSYSGGTVAMHLGYKPTN
ncbi:demethylmenaquinone methyltransferase [Enterococcus saccharolyticus]|uniref:Demethylmenaquinone methyltransferase n=1 Tax=Enterococcus saccharolyticus 30_1 TaxID=742813 RepID=A0AA87FIC5_9ENTE|nr:demethylmenaquinone methyltransferase [Enterococcus saccharolyticus]EHG29873.1 menaquinone biosynthesis methyltransferase ubiE [Enterococcus saccharolyticus 30_1]